MIEKPNLKSKAASLPHQPGIYVMKDILGRVIYVGKARSLKNRVCTYFQPSRLQLADRKFRALVNSIYDFEVHLVKSEPEAILLEGKLIKEFRPKYNVSFRDDKRFLMVKVNLDDEIPRFALTRMKKDDGARYFGPFAHASALRHTLSMIRKKFRLRLCKAVVPDEKDYQHCLYHVIKNCSAPCIDKISREDYRKSVAEACTFLEGQSRELQEQLESEMQLAAEKLDFEKAAMLRDALEDIRKTMMGSRARKFQSPLLLGIDPEKDMSELKLALSLSTMPRIIEGFDISNISGTHSVASMVCFRDARPDKDRYRRYRIKTVEGPNDFASMGEVIFRRYRHLATTTLPASPDEPSAREKAPLSLPDLILVDGGKGQLSSALEQLKLLGIRVSIIGLAKENEEIFLPERNEPVILPRNSGALKLLQRVRDEAHRFANTYHQLLRKQRIAESILDDCPGISANRKRILLSAFGSIQKLRAAGIDEISTVEGIGPKMAETLYYFLHPEEDEDRTQQD